VNSSSKKDNLWFKPVVTAKSVSHTSSEKNLTFEQIKFRIAFKDIKQ